MLLVHEICEFRVDQLILTVSEKDKKDIFSCPLDFLASVLFVFAILLFSSCVFVERGSRLHLAVSSRLVAFIF